MSIWDSYAKYISYVQYTENSFLTCENYDAIVNTGIMLILYPRTQYDTWHHDYDESFNSLNSFSKCICSTPVFKAHRQYRYST